MRVKNSEKALTPKYDFFMYVCNLFFAQIVQILLICHFHFHFEIDILLYELHAHLNGSNKGIIQ